MASRRAEIAMSDAGLRSLLAEVKTFTLGTVSPDGTPHLSAMWFAVGDDDPDEERRGPSILFWTYTRAQKTLNMRRDPRVTLLFEAGETYAELRGAMLKGHGRLTDDVAEVSAIGEAVMLANNPGLDPVIARRQVEAQAPKRTGVRFEPARVASWDHRKL